MFAGRAHNGVGKVEAELAFAWFDSVPHENDHYPFCAHVGNHAAGAVDFFRRIKIFAEKVTENSVRIIVLARVERIRVEFVFNAVSVDVAVNVVRLSVPVNVPVIDVVLFVAVEIKVADLLEKLGQTVRRDSGGKEKCE